MICISVIPFLSSGLARITKLYPCLSCFPPCFPGFFGHSESLAFFKHGWPNFKQKPSNRLFLFNVPKVQHLSNDFQKKSGCFDYKVRTNLRTDTC